MDDGRLSLLIFDCDGVLIDSERIAAESQAEALQRIGYPITVDDMIRRFTGAADRDMYAAIEREMGCPLPSGYDAGVSRTINERFVHDLRPTAGVQQALAAIDLPVCVASSATSDKLRLGLTVAGLYERFAPHIFSADEVERGKPAPDLFLHAARRMGVSAANCLVIEDSIAGVQAAAAAGMRVIGFHGGAHCPPGHSDALAAAGAMAVFNDMRGLPALVDEIGGSPA